MNRLKLYNAYIRLVISKKDKDALRKNAFKNKMTMSDYIRNLILQDNIKQRNKTLKNELNCNDSKLVNSIIRGTNID